MKILLTLRYSLVAFAGISIFAVAGVKPAYADTGAERLTSSADVLKEIMDAPDKGIPQNLLDDAYCVVIVPSVKKLAFGFGGKYGRGFATCRRTNRAGWGAPAAVRLEGGSFGFQIGGSETDVVMLVMSADGMQHLLESKFTLGGSAAVAAGPVGRDVSAKTDAQMSAKILTYSRSRGVFAGLSLGGATLRNDLDTNKELYGKNLQNKEILLQNVKPPASADQLVTELNRYSHVQGS
jgi:lipid-binding SYLF domain-containing protein